METTRVAVALVAWERKLASSDGEPSRGALLNVDYEPDRTCISGSCSCGVHVGEMRFEPSVQDTNCAAYRAVGLLAVEPRLSHEGRGPRRGRRS